jgi:hypothetical protein
VRNVYVASSHGRGENWPAWFQKIRWDRSKAIRRLLKPLFFLVNALGYGDFMHATLRKSTQAQSCG